MLVGVLGAGQLGRMLALAGLPLGLRLRFLDPAPDSPAGQVGEQVVGGYDDPAALGALVKGLDVATFEFENVPVAAAAWLAKRVPMFPPPLALEVGQDRIAEKTLFQKVGLDVHPFAAADSAEQLAAAVEQIGVPVVVKTRRGGYDGKGQAIIRTPEEGAECRKVWAGLGSVPLLVEKLVAFERELSVIGVRSRSGETAVYPLVQNVHSGGILRVSESPAPNVTAQLQEQAEEHIRSVMTELGYVGVLAIEFFDVGGKLLANELAPRVHNSGHWTIEGSTTSQFENHLRAIAGLPLGQTGPRDHSIMLNLIGNTPEVARILGVPRAHLHMYGKAPRPGRKIGHVTVTGESPEECRAAAERVREIIAPYQA